MLLLPKQLSLPSAAYLIGFLTLSGSLTNAAATTGKPELKLFPKEITPGNSLLIPYFTRRSLFKRDADPEQWAVVGGDVDGYINGLELPRVGEVVEMIYGKGSGKNTADPFISTVELIPPPNRAILVLEGYLFSVLNGVRCEDDSKTILLDMLEGSEVQAKINAFNQWMKGIVQSRFKELVVVTSSDLMRGCGQKERKAFLVKSIKNDTPSTLTTTLTVQPLEWSKVAKKLSMSFGPLSETSLGKRSLSNTLHQDSFLLKRQSEDDDPEDGIQGSNQTTFDPDFGSRLKLFPLPAGVSAVIQAGGLPIDAFSNKLFGGDKKPNRRKRQSEEEEEEEEAPPPPLTVTCVGCGIRGTIGYAGRFDIDANMKFPKSFEDGLNDIKNTFIDIFNGDDDENEENKDKDDGKVHVEIVEDEQDALIHIDHAWLKINILEDLITSLFLEFATGPEPFSYAFQQSIFPAMGSQDGIRIPGFGIPGIGDVSVYLDIAVGFSIDVTAPDMNVTMGGELIVPKGSSVFWDLVNEQDDESSTWDVSTKLSPININDIITPLDDTTTDILSISANISAIPSVTVNLNCLGLVDIGARISLEMPKLSTKTTLVKNVTDTCQAPPKDSFYYYPYAIRFESGLHAEIIAEIYAEIELELGGPNTNDPNQKPKDGEQDNTNGTIIPSEISFPFPILSRTLHTFPPACFIFGDPKTRKGEFKNATLETVKDEEMILDIPRLEKEFKSTGKLPDAKDIDWKDLLEEYGDDVSGELKKKVEEKIKVGGGDSKDTGGTFVGGKNEEDPSNGVGKMGSGKGSLWTMAIVALGAGMFP